MKAYIAGACDDCGFTTPPSRSEARAAYSLRRHSCERQHTLAARARRVTARKADTGPRRACSCPIATHVHGTHVAYVVDKCRCRPCRDASAAYENDRQRQRAYGRQSYVLAGPARDHVLHLGEQGMGWKRVALTAGVERSTVWKLIYGDKGRDQPPSRRIRPATEAKILAVTLDLAGGAIIDGTGTRRRLQALVANGWSQTRLGAQLGMANGNLNTLLHARRGVGVQVSTARDVRALYDELWNTTPPAENRWLAAGISHAKTAAARHGWVKPLCWDDDAIDDPDATPNTGVEDRPAPNVGRRCEDIAEDVDWYLRDIDAMATTDHVAHRLGITKSGIQKALAPDRANRPDLLARLTRNAKLAGFPTRSTA